MNRFLLWLRAPVDGASLAVFRIAFGAILLWDVTRYWSRIQRLFLDSLENPGGGFQFKYYGWEWVQVLPGDGMYALFAVIGLAAPLAGAGNRQYPCRPPPGQIRSTWDTPLLILLGAFLTYNIVMPMRPLIYPGPVAWTEEGHRFSWRMKLRDKEARVKFRVHDPDSGRSWQVSPAIWLTRRQFEKMASRPDMILQFAHHLDRVWQEKFQVSNPVVTALTLCSLNYRSLANLIAPERNLSAIPRSLKSADWIQPLDRTLKPGHLLPYTLQ